MKQIKRITYYPQNIKINKLIDLFTSVNKKILKSDCNILIKINQEDLKLALC